jgi:phage host-nuclease inhibitor protein Gam
MKIENTITSTEALDSRIAECVRLKLRHKTLTAEMETAVAQLQKGYAARLGKLADDCAEVEVEIKTYCDIHRAALFPEKKSRDTLTAEIGYEITPPRVETASRKITWSNVVERLLRLAWGKAYVRNPTPQPDKPALLADRDKFTPEQLNSAGIRFLQDEQFFIRPKSEVAEATTQPA